MKKFLFTAFVSGIAIVCKPQSTAPIGFGNNHFYSEADGIDESNFFVSGIASDGIVFFHAHNGSLYRKGNNYVHKVKFPATVSPIFIESVIEMGENQYAAYGEQYYYFIEDDSITRICRLPELNLTWAKIGNNLIAANSNNLYRFEKDSLVSKLKIPEATGSRFSFFADGNNNLWIVKSTGDKFDYYRINNLWSADFKFSLRHPKNPAYVDTFSFDQHLRLDLTYIGDINNPNSSPVQPDFPPPPSTSKYTYRMANFQHSIITNLRDSSKEKYNILHKDKLVPHNLFDSTTHCFYFGTMNKPFRYFPYLKVYPKIFNHATSSAIHAITQDSSGRIWVASYEGGLSILSKNKVVEYHEDGLIFLPGSFSTSSHVYLNSEQVKYGLLQYDIKGHKKGLSPNLLGYYMYLSKNKQDFYFGSWAYQGLLKTATQSLESGVLNWKKIDSTYGNKLKAIASITEDTRGRIWMGSATRGFAVYYPDKDKATTWLVSKNETSVSFLSSCTDDKGTVWLGTGRKGLMYYNDYSSDTIDAKKIFKIEYPLLQDGTEILQLKIWNKWLIMGTGKDILLMDIEKWHETQEIFIRYLNPQEGDFTASPEQNTILVDRRDSTVWFATSDMLYQWDIKEWLSIPVYKVKPNIVLHTSTGGTALIEDQLTKVKPTDNSLKFSVWFQSRDNMPRYMSVAFIKKGDSLLFPPPSLQTQFEYNNLAPGNYELLIQICQSDGSVSIHKYPFLIKKFWWQYWWVWAIFFLALFIPFTLWILSRNKAKLAEEKAKRREAELESIKAEQQKQLSTLQIVSLGNQFRPHFILNALNTVGAELDNKPQAESVLSRLGESIDLIFNHAQQQKIAHSLPDEWRLVKNVIDIHQMMYLKKLETDISDQVTIDRFSKILIPLGLVQIPVENALLHGLSNRETGPWKLAIDIEETEQEVIIHITDNGVGRLKAATLSNYRKHGTGTKNLNSILEIVNAGKNEKINISYIDGIFSIEDENYGTKVIITIPKNFQYEI